MELKGKRILVIGGAGRIGSPLVAQVLQTDGKDVIIYGHFGRGVKTSVRERVELLLKLTGRKDLGLRTSRPTGTSGSIAWAARRPRARNSASRGKWTWRRAGVRSLNGAGVTSPRSRRGANRPEVWPGPYGTRHASHPTHQAVYRRGSEDQSLRGARQRTVTKQGFSVPDASGFKGESMDYVRRTLRHLETRLDEGMARETVTDLVPQHLRGEPHRRLRIWSLPNLEWRRTVFAAG